MGKIDQLSALISEEIAKGPDQAGEVKVLIKLIFPRAGKAKPSP